MYSIYKKLGKTFDDSIIHKEIKLDDLHDSRTDKDVAKGIEDYYIKIFIIDKIDINRVDEDIKAISIGLFDWMEKNKEKVQNLMEFFKDKLNRARLLDLTVVNTLHEKSKFYDIFKKYFKNEDIFDIFMKNEFSEDIFKKFIDFINSSKNVSEKIINRGNVYINLDDLPINIRSNYDQDELFQRIGNAGEKAAYEYLIEEYKKKEYFQKENENDLNFIKLYKKNCNDFVEIKLCNTFIYKQPGYNIEIIIQENGQKITKYVEVKTHTKNSILSGKIKLSYAQYCLSRGNKDYIVIIMKAFFFDNEIKCKLNKKFDPFYSYEGKEIRPEQREYLFEFDE